MERLQEMVYEASNGHMTPKGQGRDPDIFGAKYLGNDWRQGLGSNGAPIKKTPYGESNRHVIDDVT